jgi:hypothetical protein
VDDNRADEGYKALQDAQLFNTRIEYDADNMKVTNHPEMDAYIKEPMRKGFSYGEKLWK